jgi:hypothetical protein
MNAQLKECLSRGRGIPVVVANTNYWIVVLTLNDNTMKKRLSACGKWAEGHMRGAHSKSTREIFQFPGRIRALPPHQRFMDNRFQDNSVRRKPGAPVRIRATFVVENGRPGAVNT